jgi:glycosyltransferase involved in cell wall biosynthesis
VIATPLPTDRRLAAISPMRGLRVALVGSGSSCIQTSLLATGLQLDGARIERIVPNAPVHLAAARVPYVRDRLRLAKLRAALRAAVAEGADLVHVETVPRSGLETVVGCAVAVARDAGVRVVVRLLATPSGESEAALAAADEIVVPSPYLREWLRSRLGLGSTYIPHIAEDSGLEAPPVRSDGRLRLLCARPLHAQHGVDVVLDAAARAVASGIDLELVVAGNGPEHSSLERQAGRALPRRVTFAGDLPRDDLLRALRESDAVIDASVSDDFPAVLADALAAGIPAASGAAPGVAWIVDHGETGLVTPVGDAAALAESIARLDRDRAATAALGWCAKIRALRRTWDAVRGEWAAAYGVTATA